jgi:hypothetical protein
MPISGLWPVNWRLVPSVTDAYCGLAKSRMGRTNCEWMTRDELDKIGAADELELASLPSDAAPQEPVTIWVVRHGGNLYVRSMKGRMGMWYQRIQMRHQGNIRAGGWRKT